MQWCPVVSKAHQKTHTLEVFFVHCTSTAINESTILYIIYIVVGTKSSIWCNNVKFYRTYTFRDISKRNRNSILRHCVYLLGIEYEKKTFKNVNDTLNTLFCSKCSNFYKNEIEKLTEGLQLVGAMKWNHLYSRQMIQFHFNVLTFLTASFTFVLSFIQCLDCTSESYYGPFNRCLSYLYFVYWLFCRRQVATLTTKRWSFIAKPKRNPACSSAW